MGDEVSGSESDISLSVSCLRAVLLAKMSERLHRLVYRRALKKKNKTKQRETNKSRRRRCQIHEVSAENLHFLNRKIFYGSVEATRTCKQIIKSASTPGEMALGRPERRGDNR